MPASVAWGLPGADDPADARRSADARLLLPALAAWAGAAAAPLLAPRAATTVALALAALGLAAALAGAARRPRPAPAAPAPAVLPASGASAAARPWTAAYASPPSAAAATSGRRAVAAVVTAVFICTAAGFAVVAVRRHAVADSPLAALARGGAGATVEAVLTADPFPLPSHFGGAPSYLLDARAERVRSGRTVVALRAPVLVLVSGSAWARLLPSTRLRLAGTLAPPRAGDDVAAVVRVRGSPEVIGAPSGLQRAAGSLRAGLRRASAGLPVDEAGLLPGLVDGDTSGLPGDLQSDFRVTGLTHLVAVSGSNVAAVLAAALMLTRRTGLRSRARPFAAGAVLVGFVVLARPSASVLRSAVMGGLALAGTATGRTRPALAALSATVLGLVLVDPALAVQPGFALSTLAAGALLLLAPGWRESLLRRGFSPRAAEAIAVPAAAQLICGPVIAAFAGSVSLVAVLANLLAAPAVPLATVAGVSAAVLAPVSGTLAAAAAWVAAAPCWWLVTVARTGAHVPAASVPWPSGVTGGLLLLAASVVGVAVVRRLGRLLLRSAARGAVQPPGRPLGPGSSGVAHAS